MSAGLLVLSVATFATLFGPKYVHNMFIDLSTICNENDSAFKSWASNLDSDRPAITGLFLYDVKNAADFLQNGAKAEVDEIGPFAFDCRDKHFNVVFKGATVEYKSFRRCSFVEEKSCEDCKFSNGITNLSPGYAKVLALAMNEVRVVHDIFSKSNESH